MRLQRLVAVLLIFTLFIAVIGCSASGTGTKDGSITSADDTSKSDETANDASLRKNAKDSLPDNLDFDGAKFVIMTRSESPYYEEFTAEINGEIVNDTVYKRNLTAAERLHVSIGTIAVTGNWPNAGNFQDKVRSTVLSGTTDYHAIAEYTEGINSLWYEGMLMDFNDIEYIDFSQPWWNQSIINEFTIGGRLYFLSGELALSLMSHSIVLFYNQRIAKDYSINNLYDLVLNGTWSFDEMCGMIKMVTTDVNGDGLYDKNDLYGIGLPLNSQIDAFYASFDNPITGNNDAGEMQIIFDVDKMSKVLVTLNDLIYKTNTVYTSSSFDDAFSNEVRQLFTTDHFLFHPNTLYSAGTDYMRNMTSDFGIIPYPKYNEAQSDYYTYSWNQYSLFCVPVTCSDTAMTGAVLELLAAETYRNVTEMYFEEALKHKYSRDDASCRMLDLIIANIDINFGYTNSGLIFLLRNMIRDNDNNLASKYASSEKSYITSLEDTLKSYAKIAA